MKVKVSIPHTLDDITIGQFQEMSLLNKHAKENMSSDEIREFDNKFVTLLTGIEDVDTISEVDRTYILESTTSSLLKEGEFKDRFTIDGIEFGMIPNLDKITGSEYTDLIKYYDNVEDYHRFFAVAYRPVRFKGVFSNYSIVNYTGTSEMSEIMKNTPMSIVKGFNAFFLSLSNDLENHIQKSTAEELAKEIAL